MRALVLIAFLALAKIGFCQLNDTKWSFSSLYNDEKFFTNVYLFNHNVSLNHNIIFKDGKFKISDVNSQCLNNCFSDFYGNYIELDSHKIIFRLDSIKNWGYANCENKTLLDNKTDTFFIVKNSLGIRIYNKNILNPKRNYFYEQGFIEPKTTGIAKDILILLKEFYNLSIENLDNKLFLKTSVSTFISLRNIYIQNIQHIDNNERMQHVNLINTLNNHFLYKNKKFKKP